MANLTIAQLPTAQTLTGLELVPVVQNGTTVQTTAFALASSPVLTQTFLTVGAQPTLANSRSLAVGASLALADGGAAGLLTLNLTGAPLSLATSPNGMQVKTASGTLTSRSIAVGSGLAVANGDGIAGNPTVSYSGIMLNLAALSGTGFVVTTGGTVTPVSIAGTTSQIVVANGNGVGSPTIALSSDPIVPGNAAILLPKGSAAQRPAGVPGQLRYSTDLAAFEGFIGSGWLTIQAGSAGVTQISTGTGLSGGPITTSGTVSIANTAVTAGSYGSATQVGQFTVNAQGQLTLAANVTITPSGIGAVASVTGTTSEITSTGTTAITLSLPAALTFTGKTVTGGTFAMAAGTVNGDTVTTNVTAQTVTNKAISLGSIDNTPIGATTATTGRFTTVTAVTGLTGALTGTVGATSQTTGQFTTVTATSGISGGTF